jgi:CRISPR/Cas system CSM-associated protein Csm4 (group 5 of RAMP superfamily)
MTWLEPSHFALRIGIGFNVKCTQIVVHSITIWDRIVFAVIDLSGMQLEKCFNVFYSIRAKGSFSENLGAWSQRG